MKRETILIVFMVAVTCLLLVNGCVGPAVDTDHVGAGQHFKVELLFVKDGHKVYRFYDAQQYRYFVVPGAQAMGSESTDNKTFWENSIRTADR